MVDRMESRLKLIGIVFGDFLPDLCILLLVLVCIDVAFNEDTLRVIFGLIEHVLGSCCASRSKVLLGAFWLAISVIYETALFLGFAELIEVSWTSTETCRVAVTHGSVLVVQLLQLHLVLVDSFCGARLDEVVDWSGFQLLVNGLDEFLGGLGSVEHHGARSMGLQIALRYVGLGSERRIMTIWIKITNLWAFVVLNRRHLWILIFEAQLDCPLLEGLIPRGIQRRAILFGLVIKWLQDLVRLSTTLVQISHFSLDKGPLLQMSALLAVKLFVLVHPLALTRFQRSPHLLLLGHLVLNLHFEVSVSILVEWGTQIVVLLEQMRFILTCLIINSSNIIAIYSLVLVDFLKWLVVVLLELTVAEIALNYLFLKLIIVDGSGLVILVYSQRWLLDLGVL